MNIWLVWETTGSLQSTVWSLKCPHEISLGTHRRTARERELNPWISVVGELSVVWSVCERTNVHSISRPEGSLWLMMLAMTRNSSFVRAWWWCVLGGGREEIDDRWQNRWMLPGFLTPSLYSDWHQIKCMWCAWYLPCLCCCAAVVCMIPVLYEFWRLLQNLLSSS